MTIFDTFWQFLKTILETCDIWDIDYNSDNWDPEFMAIFVYLTINCDTGQHSQFLRCFIMSWFCWHLPRISPTLTSVLPSFLPPEHIIMWTLVFDSKVSLKLASASAYRIFQTSTWYQHQHQHQREHQHQYHHKG